MRPAEHRRKRLAAVASAVAMMGLASLVMTFAAGRSAKPAAGRDGAPPPAPNPSPAASQSPATQPKPPEKPPEKPAGKPAEEPPQDPYARLLQAGWHELDMVNHVKALGIFEEVEKGAPSRAERAEAKFALGHLWQYRRPGSDVGEARRHYTEVAEQYADTPAGPLAWMALARLADAPEYEKDRDKASARELYREILKRYPDHFVAAEATLWLAMTYLSEAGNAEAQDQGARMIRDYLAGKPDNLLAAVMHAELGGFSYNRKEYRKAVGHWIAADEADEAAGKAEMKDSKAPPGSQDYYSMSLSARAGLYYRIARVCEQHLKDYATAARWYDRIVTDVRHDSKYYWAKVSAERCRKLAASQPASGAASGAAAGAEGGP